MLIIFCDNGSPKEVDFMYLEEWETAKQLKIETALMNFEDLQKRKNPAQATQRIKPRKNLIQAIYRGWMLKDVDYQQLYEILLSKNIKLINNPAAYNFCHYLPNWYEFLNHISPKTVFINLEKGFYEHEILEKIQIFGNSPIIVKDYVKSQKHYWHEACFIPNASDTAQVLKVSQRFLQLQGEDLNKGLVYRQFLEFQPLAQHSQSDMPLTKEFRIFVFNQQIISILAYWDEGDYENAAADLDFLENEIPRINSHFYTIDIAQTKTGEWLIIELGDAQVAGLPDNANKLDFYKNLQHFFA